MFAGDIAKAGGRVLEKERPFPIGGFRYKLVYRLKRMSVVYEEIDQTIVIVVKEARTKTAQQRISKSCDRSQLNKAPTGRRTPNYLRGSAAAMISFLTLGMTTNSNAAFGFAASSSLDN